MTYLYSSRFYRGDIPLKFNVDINNLILPFFIHILLVHVDRMYLQWSGNVFITENLTPRRRKIMDELNYLRVKRRIQACWSHDGRIFAIGVNSRSTDLITCIDDIYFMLDKYPENPSSADTELPEPQVLGDRIPPFFVKKNSPFFSFFLVFL